VIYLRILAVAGATSLLLLTFLLPVSALLLGFVFLSESLTPESIDGMALIGIGLTAIDGRIWKAMKIALVPCLS
jgi:drug/metabolite transporter (DMT)-like permease